MRILLLNDGADDAGGVATYLSAFEFGMRQRGHQTLQIALRNSTSDTSEGASSPLAQADRRNARLAEATQFTPDLCYSHNMNDLVFEESIVRRWPTFKFMHGYFGTCISGLKSTRSGGIQPCSRLFGLQCLALYFPLRCGRFRVGSWVNGFRWSRRQQRLFKAYRAILVASEAMRTEYVNNGSPPETTHCNPLFAPQVDVDPRSVNRATKASWLDPKTQAHKIIFLGRMTPLKGLSLAIEAVSMLPKSLGNKVQLVCAGDGPDETLCRREAARLGVEVSFLGWIDPKHLASVFQDAALLVLPSVWPEPFGLVGLEAGRHGIPAVSFDVGGIGEWLHHGVNGLQVPQGDLSASGLARSIVEILQEEPVWRRFSDRALAMAHRLTLSAHLDRFEALCESQGLPSHP